MLCQPILLQHIDCISILGFFSVMCEIVTVEPSFLHRRLQKIILILAQFSVTFSFFTALQRTVPCMTYTILL